MHVLTGVPAIHPCTAIDETSAVSETPSHVISSAADPTRTSEQSTRFDHENQQRQHHGSAASSKPDRVSGEQISAFAASPSGAMCIMATAHCVQLWRTKPCLLMSTLHLSRHSQYANRSTVRSKSHSRTASNASSTPSNAANASPLPGQGLSEEESAFELTPIRHIVWHPSEQLVAVASHSTMFFLYVWPSEASASPAFSRVSIASLLRGGMFGSAASQKDGLSPPPAVPSVQSLASTSTASPSIYTFANAHLDDSSPTTAWRSDRAGVEGRVLQLASCPPVPLGGRILAMTNVLDDIMVATTRGRLERVPWLSPTPSDTTAIDLANLLSAGPQDPPTSASAEDDVAVGVSLVHIPFLHILMVTLGDGSVLAFYRNQDKTLATPVYRAKRLETQAVAVSVSVRFRTVAIAVRGGGVLLFSLSKCVKTSRPQLSLIRAFTAEELLLPVVTALSGMSVKHEHMTWSHDGRSLVIVLAMRKEGSQASLVVGLSAFGAKLFQMCPFKSAILHDEEVATSRRGLAQFACWSQGDSSLFLASTLVDSSADSATKSGASSAAVPEDAVPESIETLHLRSSLIELQAIHSALADTNAFTHQQHVMLLAEGRRVLMLPPQHHVMNARHDQTDGSATAAAAGHHATLSSLSSLDNDRDRMCEQHWLALEVPESYISRHSPLMFAACDLAGSNIAVAGTRGLCLYSMTQNRWQLFSSVVSELSFSVTGGLAWWRDDVVIAGCVFYPQEPGKTSSPDALSTSTVLHHQRWGPSPTQSDSVASEAEGTGELVFFSRKRRLHVDQVLLRRQLRHAPHLIDVQGDFLLVVSKALRALLYHIRSDSNDEADDVAAGPSSVSLSLLLMLDLREALEPSFVDLHSVSHADVISASIVPGDDAFPSAMVFNICGRVVSFSISQHRRVSPKPDFPVEASGDPDQPGNMTCDGDQCRVIDGNAKSGGPSVSANGMDGGKVGSQAGHHVSQMAQDKLNNLALSIEPPAVLATGVEQLWVRQEAYAGLNGAQSSGSTSASLYDALWLFCGDKGLKVWMPLSPENVSASRPEHLQSRAMLSFPISSLPLAVMPSLGIVVGTTHTSTIMTTPVAKAGVQRSASIASMSSLSGRGSCADETFTSILAADRRTELFAHHLIRTLLRRNAMAAAKGVAASLQHVQYFPHILELVLHHVLEEEADGTSPAPLLPRVVEFLKLFPCKNDVIVHCARKTEVAKWKFLFEAVGDPRDLFKASVASGHLDTAASMLMVLQASTAPSVTRSLAVSLCQRVLIAGRWDLALDLQRFLMATTEIDEAFADDLQAFRSASAVPWETRHKRAGEVHDVSLRLFGPYAFSLLCDGHLKQLGVMSAGLHFDLQRWLCSTRLDELNVKDFGAMASSTLKDFGLEFGHDFDSAVPADLQEDSFIPSSPAHLQLQAVYMQRSARIRRQLQWLHSLMVEAEAKAWALLLGVLLRDQKRFVAALFGQAGDDGGVVVSPNTMRMVIRLQAQLAQVGPNYTSFLQQIRPLLSASEALAGFLGNGDIERQVPTRDILMSDSQDDMQGPKSPVRETASQGGAEDSQCVVS